MEKPILRDPGQQPDDSLLEKTLGSSFRLYKSLRETLAPDGVTFDWNYYKDGGAWLCKVTRKKKTLCWISPWEGSFRAGFYFTEKHVPAIAELPIADAVKEAFFRAKSIGKLIPLSFTIDDATAGLDDLLTVAAFKKELK